MYYHTTTRKSYPVSSKTKSNAQNCPRPLPRPPTPESSRTSISSLNRNLPPRPLPAPPLHIDPSSSISSKQLQTSSPPSSYQKGKHPSVLLTLNTSSEFLACPSRSSKIPPSSSPTSILQAPPTPRTARQKRITKLERHLGEPIPDDLVPLAPTRICTHDRELSHSDSVRKKGRARDSVTVQRLRDFKSAQASDTDSGSEGSEKELWDPSVAHYTAQTHSSVDPRSSTRSHGTVRQWLWEKAGRRWEEENPADVVRALRSL
ncbi:hypothetical protein FB446DRAFT_711716 [Lentinula raphanica]|nr:hypothetical protein FB446DRAFT_711716 [Lentinula raphanica]